MTHTPFAFTSWRGVLSALMGFTLLTALAACTVSPTQPSAEAPVWPPVYSDAIQDALNPEPSEVAHDLVAIVPDNPMLSWKSIAGAPHVLMVTLTGNTSYYQDYVGRSYDTGSHYIWVTAVPQVKDLCSQPGFGGDDLPMRLRQLIGLTPTAPVTAFVEFWVPPGQLFRPSPDNEVTDSTAGLVMPGDAAPWYREWFNQLRAGQYFQSQEPPHDAYPWTQLGYTYDWGNAESEQGASEFVIKTEATVVVNGIFPIDAYCGRMASAPRKPVTGSVYRRPAIERAQ